MILQYFKKKFKTVAGDYLFSTWMGLELTGMLVTRPCWAGGSSVVPLPGRYMATPWPWVPGATFAYTPWGRWYIEVQIVVIMMCDWFYDTIIIDQKWLVRLETWKIPHTSQVQVDVNIQLSVGNNIPIKKFTIKA